MVEEKIVSAYQYTFNGMQGQDVLMDLRRLCRIDEPLIGTGGIPDDREILVHATLRDVYEYISAMADGQGE